jgi:hypothetical protein
MGHRSIANTVVYTAVADKRIRNIWANKGWNKWLLVPAIVVLGILYLAVISRGFRMVCLGVVALSAVGILWLSIEGADKPQTFFYNGAAHPAFLLKAGDVCPQSTRVEWMVREMSLAQWCSF